MTMPWGMFAQAAMKKNEQINASFAQLGAAAVAAQDDKLAATRAAIGGFGNGLQGNSSVGKDLHAIGSGSLGNANSLLETASLAADQKTKQFKKNNTMDKILGGLFGGGKQNPSAAGGASFVGPIQS